MCQRMSSTQRNYMEGILRQIFQDKCKAKKKREIAKHLSHIIILRFNEPFSRQMTSTL